MNPQFGEIERAVRALCESHGADRIFVLTDSGVAPLVEGLFPDAPWLVVEAGEGSKSLEGAEKVWRFLVDGGALRRSVLVNVGGGMVSDLGGFAAATFKRGIGCVNLPTTLLAAVDAAIGGKTGINFAGLKNEVGAFAMPLGVFPLTSLFPYLPQAEWLSGVGEAIKTGLLDSKELYAMATSEEFVVDRKPEIVDEVVSRCAAFKQRIVSEDFRESGRRRILNLGHTPGHAIEEWKMAHGEAMPHGVAVAHGLLFALERSAAQAGFPLKEVDRYRVFLQRYFPSLGMSGGELEEAWAYMAHDKKITQAGRPSWVLLRDIGVPIVEPGACGGTK